MSGTQVDGTAGPERSHGWWRQSLVVVVVVLVLAGVAAWFAIPWLASRFDVVGNWQDHRHACVTVIRNSTAEQVTDAVATFEHADGLQPFRIGDLSPGQAVERHGKPPSAMKLDYVWRGQLLTRRLHTKLWGGRVVVVILGNDVKIESNEEGAAGSGQGAAPREAK